MAKGKKDPEKLARIREKKERKLLEAQIKQSNAKLAEAKAVLDAPIKGVPNYQKAVQALDAAIEAYPENAEAFTYRGHCLRDQLMAEEAVEDYTKAATLAPTSVEALEGRAMCFELLKDWDHAMHDYTTIISLHPENDHAYNMRGAALLKKRPQGLVMKIADFESVLSDFQTALKLNENNFVAFTNLGKAYANQRRYQDAIDAFTNALKVKDDYTYARYRRACASLSLSQDLSRTEDKLSKELAAANMVLQAQAQASATGNTSSSFLPPLNGRRKSILDKPGGAMSAATAASLTGNPVAVSIHANLNADPLSPEEQIAKEDELEEVRNRRKKLLNSAVNDFLACINPEAKQDELTAVVHLGTCYMDLGEDKKAKEELLFAQHYIQTELCGGDGGNSAGSSPSTSPSKNSAGLNNTITVNNVTMTLNSTLASNVANGSPPPLLLGSTITGAYIGDIAVMLEVIASKLKTLDERIQAEASLQFSQKGDGSLAGTVTSSPGK